MINIVNFYLKEINKIFSYGIATESTYRSSLEKLIKTLKDNIEVINEPKRIKCGAPDIIITHNQIPFGYIETKDITANLDTEEKSEQIQRYIQSLDNFILTNYLEFRLYNNGELKFTVTLALINSRKTFTILKAEHEKIFVLVNLFFNSPVPLITTSKELAIHIARVAWIIKDSLIKTMEYKKQGKNLYNQMEGFRQVFLKDLSKEEFVDMYTQTICYGVFTARCNTVNSDEIFDRRTAAYILPKTNPFLRKIFSYFSGPDLDDTPYTWAIDHLIKIINLADIEVILKEFYMKSRKEDPVIHFYETFLSEYNPKIREIRGVYYTPEPVVDYIVRSVDQILKGKFSMPMGLADNSKITTPKSNLNKINISKEKTTTYDIHKLLILDPAVGTGTFLYSIIRHIYGKFKDNEGLWSGYVSHDLLPRLYGFELLMAPYAIAHLKLGILLAELGYSFEKEERLKIYLTNTLEEANENSGTSFFATWLADEADAASEIKNEMPVMVILGNPPYKGHSSNRGKWINNLLKGIDIKNAKKKTNNYFEIDGRPLNEVNLKWLYNDYVKFIRFAQYKIEKTGHGIVAFITDHGYLNNPTFSGMRQALLETFDKIFILDLNGNSRRNYNGLKDENVFDIKQGVAICFLIKFTPFQKNNQPQVYYANLVGEREYKNNWLNENDFKSTNWINIEPENPQYLFVPQNKKLKSEYNNYFYLPDILIHYSLGVLTKRDALVVGNSEDDLLENFSKFSDLSYSDIECAELFNISIKDKDKWDITKSRDIARQGFKKDLLQKYLYRPFDYRSIYYHKSFIARPNTRIMHNLVNNGDNYALVIGRQGQATGSKLWDVVFITNCLIDQNIFRRGGGTVFPKMTFSNDDGFLKTKYNINEKILQKIEEKIGLKFTLEAISDLKTTFNIDDFFCYIYSILHSGIFRKRYDDFLKEDFPRIPIPSDLGLFSKLIFLGKQLQNTHLKIIDLPAITCFPVPGNSFVKKILYDIDNKRIWINAQQYFEGIEENVWNHTVGGYQICLKWLKDRKGKYLDYEELLEYQNIIVQISETNRLAQNIDFIISQYGGFPFL